MKLRRAAQAAAVATLAAISLTTTPAAHATTPPNPTLASAEVLARGAAVRLTFDSLCDFIAAPVGNVSLTLTQPQTGEREANTTVRCYLNQQGRPPVSIVILPPPGGPAFKRGEASIRGQIQPCGEPVDWGATCWDPKPFEFTVRLTGGEAMPAPANSRIHIASATLVSGGTAVRVIVDGTGETCISDGDSEYNLVGIDASISQRVGRTTTQSSAGGGPDNGCGHTTWRSTLLLPVQPGRRHFQPKLAYIQAQWHYCVPFVVEACDDGSVESVTRLSEQPTT